MQSWILKKVCLKLKVYTSCLTVTKWTYIDHVDIIIIKQIIYLVKALCKLYVTYIFMYFAAFSDIVAYIKHQNICEDTKASGDIYHVCHIWFAFISGLRLVGWIVCPETCDASAGCISCENQSNSVSKEALWPRLCCLATSLNVKCNECKGFNLKLLKSKMGVCRHLSCFIVGPCCICNVYLRIAFRNVISKYRHLDLFNWNFICISSFIFNQFKVLGFFGRCIISHVQTLGFCPLLCSR